MSELTTSSSGVSHEECQSSEENASSKEALSSGEDVVNGQELCVVGPSSTSRGLRGSSAKTSANGDEVFKQAFRSAEGKSPLGAEKPARAKQEKMALSAVAAAKRKDPNLKRRRKKLQGTSGKMFSEGWVEFTDKKVAKRVAEMLNGNPMGGKKRSAYHYDIWCLKYLPKFQWDHLTEEIAYQNAVREQKLATEISAAKRERDFYMSRVDRAKAEEAKEQRRKRKTEALKEDEPATAKEVPSSKVKRTFGQKAALSHEENAAEAKSLPASVLALVAGKKQT